MEEQEKVEEVVEEQPEQPEVAEPQETVEELKQRLENAKAENARKAEKLRQLQEELESKARYAEPVEAKFNPQDLTTWKDHELKAVLKDAQYAALHDQAQELLDKRRFQRYQREESEKNSRVMAELERQQKYPETLDPTSPMSIRMSQLIHEHRLENHPQGRLLAARLAASELEKQKATAAGRKQEQTRQADVKANFQGDASRPAPKVSDKIKMEELKKKAMAGDEAARAEWFRLRGII